MKKTLLFGLMVVIAVMMTMTVSATQLDWSLQWTSPHNDSLPNLFTNGDEALLWSVTSDYLYSNDSLVSFTDVSDELSLLFPADKYSSRMSDDGEHLWVIEGDNQYLYHVVNVSQYVTGTNYTGTPENICVGENIYGVDISSDGQYVVVTCGSSASLAGWIYYSDDYGSSWSVGATSGIYFTGAGISKNGQYMIGTEFDSGSQASLSDDFGATWNYIYHNVDVSNKAALSNDGQTIIILPRTVGNVSRSTNGGTSFSFVNVAADGGTFQDIECSADLQNCLITVADSYPSGRVYYSDDYGATWELQTDVLTTEYPIPVSVTADGEYFIATIAGVIKSGLPCTPDWSCDGYGTPVCYPDDTSNASCNSVTDLNACGENYTGNYSEFPDQVGVCDYCTPSWSCSSFGNCSSEDVLPCSAVNDTNACGESFNGTLSDYDGACDYCTPSWTCTGYGACVEETQTQPCNSVVDLNLCGEPYTGNYSEFTPQACYAPGAYEGDDLGKMVVDGLAAVLVFFISGVWVIVILYLYDKYIRKK